jgi:DNA-binding NarL/FixJ family response regulator
MQILIADSLALVRGAFCTLLEGHGHHVIAQAATADDAVDLACRHEPDVVLMDLEGAPLEMMAAARRISSARPHMAVVLLAGPDDGDLFLDALSCGARGFVTRDLDEKIFCTLLERAAAGEIVVAPGLAAKLLDVYARTSLGAPHPRHPMVLTPREHEVLSRMTRGQTSNRELAEALGLSENTVRFHVRNILEKFHVHSRAAVVAYAYSHDVVGAGEDGSAHR